MIKSFYNDEKVVLHVALCGNDSWTGLLEVPDEDKTDGPLATLAGARDKVRVIRKAHTHLKSVEVLVHSGMYEIRETLFFGIEDLGSCEFNIVYRSAGDGEVILTGGIRLKGFESHGGGKYKLDLNLTQCKPPYFRQLFCDGVRQQLSRYPNYDPADPYDGGWLYVEGDIPENVMGLYRDDIGNKSAFYCRDDRLKQWAKPEEAEIFIFPRFNWVNDIIRIREYNPETGEIKLDKPATYEICPGDRFFFRNVLEELDSPGEWYVDKEKGILWFYPPAAMEEAVVVVPVVKNLLVIDGSPEVYPDYESMLGNVGREQHLMQDPDSLEKGFIRFEGFTIDGCDSTAIIIRNVRECSVHNCTVRNSGNDGLKVLGGAKCSITDCHVHDTGSNGISLAGGMRFLHEAVYKECGHEVRNNYIHHTGVYVKCSAGIAIRGVGIKASNNLIHDCPRWGIVSSGNRNLIEYNEIHHVNLETSDTGAIYLCDRDFTMRGTRIRYNKIHDIFGHHLLGGQILPPVITYGIYLDDYSSSVEVAGNLVYRVPMGGIFIHAGQDNIIENNMFLESESFMANFKRWEPEREYRQMGTYGQGFRRNIIRCNILASHSDKAMAYCFVKVQDANGEYDLRTNIWERNIVWCYGKPVLVAEEIFGDYMTWEQWLEKGYDTGSILADPKTGNDVFELEADSPAIALGFKPLPLERMGLLSRRHGDGSVV